MGALAIHDHGNDSPSLVLLSFTSAWRWLTGAMAA
jgi:hypothetical protein